MSKLSDLTLGFSDKMEDFTDLCHTFQQTGEWDTDNNGDMDDYYIQILMSTMLRIIASDGVISRKEAEFFNECFDTENTAEELEKMYDDSEDILSGEEYITQLREDYVMLRDVSDAAADAYKELWLNACEILIASDGQLLPQEVEDAKRLKSIFDI